MRERWLSELHKVSGVASSEDLLTRAEKGPTLPEPTPRARARLGVILVATLVAVVGLSGAFAAWQGPSGSARSAAGQTLLWPETSLADAQTVQASVDAGDPIDQWRTDVAAVARRYGDKVLDWPRPIAAVSTTDDPDVSVVILNGPDASCETPGCQDPQPQTAVRLTLERVVRSGDGGIWSVTEVDSAAGQTLLWPETSLAGAQTVQASVDAGDPIDQWRTSATAVARRYGDKVLDWLSPIAVVSTTSDPDVSVVILKGPDASCEAPGCQDPRPRTAVRLTLERVVRPGDGGIWSVTGVDAAG